MRAWALGGLGGVAAWLAVAGCAREDRQTPGPGQESARASRASGEEEPGAGRSVAAAGPSGAAAATSPSAASFELPGERASTPELLGDRPGEAGGGDEAEDPPAASPRVGRAEPVDPSIADPAPGGERSAVVRRRFVAKRTPLLPWPFFGRGSLGSLGAEGLLALGPDSPERRLIAQLDPAECVTEGEAPGASCYFLEGGRVYELRRGADAGPAGFRLSVLPTSGGQRFRNAASWPSEGVTEPIPGARGGGTPIENVHYVVDRRDSDRPLLLSVVERTGREVSPEEER